MKNKKVMKRVLVIAIVAAVAAGGIGGWNPGTSGGDILPNL